MRSFKYKSHRSFPISAQEAGEALEDVFEGAGGSAKPRDIVEAARPEGSRLHSCFEWDDAVAAEAHREDQARYLVRSVVTVASEDVEGPQVIRAFVSIKDTETDERSYVTTSDAMEDEEIRNAVLEEVFRQLEALQEKFKDYSELAQIFESVDRAKKRHEGKKSSPRVRRTVVAV